MTTNGGDTPLDLTGGPRWLAAIFGRHTAFFSIPFGGPVKRDPGEYVGRHRAEPGTR
jgi:hypothetical protein